MPSISHLSHKPNYLLASIDGTNSFDDMMAGVYSHVRKFHDSCSIPAENKRYYHGPTLAGSEVGPITNTVVDWIVSRCKTLPRVRICIVGHSRGGAIALLTARALDSYQLKVYFTGLYDAVSRAFDIDMTESDLPHLKGISKREIIMLKDRYRERVYVPVDTGGVSNVLHVAHVFRTSKLSRPYFGNTGMNGNGSQITFRSKGFNATHGALGGDYNMDFEIVTSARSIIPSLPARYLLDKYNSDLKKTSVIEATEADRWLIEQARSVGIPVTYRKKK